MQTRAVQAETQASKLKQEVKALQTQVKALTLENQALRSGDKGLEDIRERTKYASDQLAGAAVTAEKSLR
jgi:regulator of replication initiation timing